MTCAGVIGCSQIVEIDRRAGPHVGGGDGEPYRLGIDQIKIDQTRQRRFQRRRIVVADRLGTVPPPNSTAETAAARKNRARREAWWRTRSSCWSNSARGRCRSTARSANQGKFGNPDRRLGDRFPEVAQPFDAPLRRIAGNQRTVDAADRRAANPMHVDIGFVDRLINAGLDMRLTRRRPAGRAPHAQKAGCALRLWP